MAITVSQNDYGFYITDTLENSDGTPFDLTGYSVRFRVWAIHAPTRVIVDAAAQVVSNANGTVRYLTQTTDFVTIGTFYGEWQATASGVKQSFPTGGFIVNVLESPT